MTNKKHTYEKIEETSYEICFQNTVEHPNEKWKSTIYIKKRISRNCRITIRTSVKNKSTGEKKKKSTHKTILEKRNIIGRKITGETYKTRQLPNLKKTTRKHLKKLTKKTKHMKSQDKELKKHVSNLENQIQNIEFEREIQKVKKQ